MMLLRGGRVIDPSSGRDEVAVVLVDGDRIVAIGAVPPSDGQREVDVSGLIVGPAFIDLHSHAHGIAGQRLQALDGVGTALDLEAGLHPIDAGYAAAAAEGRPLNYGYAASWAMARGVVQAAAHPDASLGATLALLARPDWQRSARPGELQRWLEVLREDLSAGALGIGILLGYAPQTDPAEMVAVARLAVEAGVATYTHVRELVEADPATPIDGSEELTVLAAETGAHMHHCHVNSTSRRHLDRVLGTIAAAQQAGSTVTVEAYPYGAGSTGVGAYFLAPERLERWGLSPSSIVVVNTGERIASAERLRELRADRPDLTVIVEYLDERAAADRRLLRSALDFPDAAVASDAMPVTFPNGNTDCSIWPLPAGGQTHPRTAGTFMKSLRLMVGSGDWTWTEAFRRCAWIPAQILSFVPSMQRKGRLGVGADADIVVLDPTTISDNATYDKPTAPSTGVRHLMVNGEFVVRDGDIVLAAYPGRPVRNQPT